MINRSLYVRAFAIGLAFGIMTDAWKALADEDCTPSAPGRVKLACIPNASLPLDPSADTLMGIQGGANKQVPPHAITDLVTMTGEVTGKFGATAIAPSGVASGSYDCPSITINAGGRISSAVSKACVASVAANAPLSAATAAGAVTLSIGTMTGTATGVPPTPPNDALKFLRGDGSWANPFVGAGAQISVGAGKTLTIGNSFSLLGTDGTSFTLPGASDTLAGLATTQSWTGVNTFTRNWISTVTTGTAPFQISSATPPAGLHVVASNVDTGTLPDAQLPADAARTGTAQTFTQPQTFADGSVFGTGGLTLAKNLTLKQITETALPLNSGSCTGSITIDLSQGSLFYCAVTGPTTFTVTNLPASGSVASFVLELANATGKTINYMTGTHWPGGTVPTLSANTDVEVFYTRDAGSNWRGTLSEANSS